MEKAAEEYTDLAPAVAAVCKPVAPAPAVVPVAVRIAVQAAAKAAVACNVVPVAAV